MEPTPPPPIAAPVAEPPRWVIEATLALVLVAHAGSLAAMTFSARTMPLIIVQTCLLAPCSLALALFAAQSVARRREGRARLAALTLLVGASTITPRFATACLDRGALRDLERAGGAAAVVSEGRALLVRWETEGRKADVADPGELGPALRALGSPTRVVPGRGVRVKSYGFGDFSGFVVQKPGTLPEGRPIADGLSWWSDAEHAPR